MKTYEQPQITLCEVMVEDGLALSTHYEEVLIYEMEIEEW